MEAQILASSSSRLAQDSSAILEKSCRDTSITPHILDQSPVSKCLYGFKSLGEIRDRELPAQHISHVLTS